MGKWLRLALLVASMTGIGACSMFERNLVYESQESPRLSLSEAASVSVRFQPINRFVSLGPWGVPIVPVGVSLTDVTEVEMLVSLSLEAHASFSLNSMPCLRAGPATVCPVSVEVEQLMNLPQTGQYPAFWVNRLELPLPITDRPRLTDEYLFALRLAGSYKNDLNEYPSARDAQWQRGYVNLKFRYSCPAACPNELLLTMDDLVRVNDQPSGGGVRQFDSAMHSKYHFGLTGEVM